MDKFVLKSNYKPMGDQPQAIDSLANGVLDGDKEQVLLGVTGSGKTFTMANIIEKVNRPTLILAHNKTLAAQLCSEFKEFFPDNAVEYFVNRCLYRKGQCDKRRDRPPATLGNSGSCRAQGCNYRCQCKLYLQLGQSGGLP